MQSDTKVREQKHKRVHWANDVYVTTDAQSAYEAAMQGVAIQLESSNTNSTPPPAARLHAVAEAEPTAEPPAAPVADQVVPAPQTSPGASTEDTQRVTGTLTQSSPTSGAVAARRSMRRRKVICYQPFRNRNKKQKSQAK